MKAEELVVSVEKEFLRFMFRQRRKLTLLDERRLNQGDIIRRAEHVVEETVRRRPRARVEESILMKLTSIGPIRIDERRINPLSQGLSTGT